MPKIDWTCITIIFCAVGLPFIMAIGVILLGGAEMVFEDSLDVYYLNE